jgi:hypothetical protein
VNVYRSAIESLKSEEDATENAQVYKLSATEAPKERVRLAAQLKSLLASSKQVTAADHDRQATPKLQRALLNKSADASNLADQISGNLQVLATLQGRPEAIRQ